jgi:endonuclease/exonuclease/phosphatase family metal-dependent hydrolase
MKYKIYYTNYQKRGTQIGGSQKELSLVTYNVYGGGCFKEERLEHITNSILEGKKPDVICLQEATLEVIDSITSKLPNYYLWTKLDAMAENNINISEEDLKKTKKEGFLAIISKWNFKTKNLVFEGNWFDDGIMKAILDSRNDLGYNLVVYNVHSIGGTYGKPQEKVLEKRKIRIKELEILNESIRKEPNRNIVIMGDFNSDSNDSKLFPEIEYYPENQIDNCYDIWSKLRPNDIGATESHENNSFRAYLKPGQNREARFDKIIYLGDKISPTSIDFIGNKSIGNVTEKEGKIVNLFPSDHFGLISIMDNL